MAGRMVTSHGINAANPRGFEHPRGQLRQVVRGSCAAQGSAQRLGESFDLTDLFYKSWRAPRMRGRPMVLMPMQRGDRALRAVGSDARPPARLRRAWSWDHGGTNAAGRHKTRPTVVALVSCRSAEARASCRDTVRPNCDETGGAARRKARACRVLSDGRGRKGARGSGAERPRDRHA